MIQKVKECKTAKQMWEKLTLVCEGTEAIKANKLSVVTQKFETFRMKEGESIDEMDCRFMAIINELTLLGKSCTQQEICLKILRALLAESRMQATTIGNPRIWKQYQPLDSSLI